MNERASAAFETLLEVTVVGAGALLALLLGAAAVAGVSLGGTLDGVGTSSLLVLGLPFSIALGVVVDRLADVLTEPLRGWTTKGLPDQEEARAIRLEVLREPALADRLEYLRTRWRIARGWAVNSLLISVAWPFYAWRADLSHWPGLAASGVVLGVLLAVGNLLTWRGLRIEERQQLQHFSKYLRRPAQTKKVAPKSDRGD